MMRASVWLISQMPMEPVASMPRRQALLTLGTQNLLEFGEVRERH